MGKHHKRRKHSKANQKAGEPIMVPKGCPFYNGQRLFDFRTGFFIGIVMAIEWCSANKQFYCTTDTNIWYYHRDIDVEVAIGQRNNMVPQFGVISLEAYGYYDQGIVEEIINCPPRPGETRKPPIPEHLDVDERAFKEYQEALAYGDYGHS